MSRWGEGERVTCSSFSKASKLGKVNFSASQGSLLFNVNWYLLLFHTKVISHLVVS